MSERSFLVGCCVLLIVLLVSCYVLVVKERNIVREQTQLIEECRSNNAALLTEIDKAVELIQTRTDQRDLALQMLQDIYKDKAIAGILKRSNDNEQHKENSTEE